MLQWLWFVPLLLGAETPRIRQPEIVPENLPPGLRTPSANFGPDGGIVFPLDQRGIRSAVDQAMPDLQRCADLNPDLYGRAVLRIHVNETASGDQATVEHVRVLGGTDVSQFEACALSALSGLTFEHPVDSKAVDIDYPLDFEAPDAGP
jgi:hypothetical protein